VLIDGICLTALMLHYSVGVEPQQKFTYYILNQDPFEE